MHMMRAAYRAATPLLFAMPEEPAHTVGAHLLDAAARAPLLGMLMRKGLRVRDSRLQQRRSGCVFENPVGLSAGFDKNAQFIRMAHAIGFGFTEVGSITALPQGGNPRPRWFRFPKQESMQNFMGFNNYGLEFALPGIKEADIRGFPVWASVGINKWTLAVDEPFEAAVAESTGTALALSKAADFIVMNPSSPNTLKLRTLLTPEFVHEFFKKVRFPRTLLKVSPDMGIDKMIELSKEAISAGAAGIIATNTTTDYSGVPVAVKKGGISGDVLWQKSRKAIGALAPEMSGKLLVASGGINGAARAFDAICAGASFVQVLTGLVFEGPSLPHDINMGLLSLLRERKFEGISDAIGSDLRR